MRIKRRKSFGMVIVRLLYIKRKKIVMTNMCRSMRRKRALNKKLIDLFVSFLSIYWTNRINMIIYSVSFFRFDETFDFLDLLAVLLTFHPEFLSSQELTPRGRSFLLFGWGLGH